MTHNTGRSHGDSPAKLRSYHADLALYLNARDRLTTPFESCAVAPIVLGNNFARGPEHSQCL